MQIQEREKQFLANKILQNDFKTNASTIKLLVHNFFFNKPFFIFFI